MSDEAAILAAVWAAPHDDTPRLVYADWLDENGDPARAEFIRVQCELARLEEWDDRRPPLLEREASLWKAHANWWRKPLPSILKRCDFRRGFPYPVRKRVGQKAFLALSPADVAAAPVWEFRFNFFGTGAPKILADERMSRAGTVHLPYCVRAGELFRAMCERARFENVAELNLSSNDIDAERVRMLVESDRLPSVRALDLSYNSPLKETAVAVLAVSPLAARLNSLDLYNTPTGDAGLSALAAADLPRLERLRVSGFGSEVAIGRDGLAAVFGSPLLTGLRDLDLGFQRLDPPAFRAILDSRPRFRLRRLAIQANGWMQGNVAALADWPGLWEVRVLQLTGHEIGPAAATALANSTQLGPNTRLRLVGSLLTRDRVARAALADRFGPRLELL